jgi:DNA-binding NtrC family response regulator
MTASHRILIVDDDDNMARTLLKILQLEGYQSEVANSGEQALGLVQDHYFDCILSDIKMPGMSGVELFQAVQHHHTNIPIILMTAYASSDLITASVTEGVVAVLNKPLDFELLFMYLDALKQG